MLFLSVANVKNFSPFTFHIFTSYLFNQANRLTAAVATEVHTRVRVRSVEVPVPDIDEVGAVLFTRPKGEARSKS